jgi:hypothetical protein
MAAKKKTRKPARKARPKAKPKRAAKKAGRPARKRAAAKAVAVSLAPRPVSTGKGPGPLEVAKRVAELLRGDGVAEVEAEWLAPSLESVEGLGVSLAWAGKPAVLAKYRGWEADHEIHDMKIEGPWVGATGFALRFWIDVTQKSTGQRSQMEEIAVYDVKDGRIVREEFHFATGA